MLVIRLARTGRKKYPTYRIVAAESSRPATGKFVAVLGHYNPHTKELVIKKDEAAQYMSNGAQPSDSVARLFKRDKVKMPAWVKIADKQRSPKHEPAATEAPAAAQEATEQEEAAQDTAGGGDRDEVAAPAETEAEPADPEASHSAAAEATDTENASEADAPTKDAE